MYMNILFYILFLRAYFIIENKHSKIMKNAEKNCFFHLTYIGYI